MLSPCFVKHPDLYAVPGSTLLTLLILFCESQEDTSWGHLSAAACFCQLPGMFSCLCPTRGWLPASRAEPAPLGAPPPAPCQLPGERRDRGSNDQHQDAPTGKRAPNSRPFYTNPAFGWCLDPEQGEAPGETAGAVGGWTRCGAEPLPGPDGGGCPGGACAGT